MVETKEQDFSVPLSATWMTMVSMISGGRYGTRTVDGGGGSSTNTGTLAKGQLARRDRREPRGISCVQKTQIRAWWLEGNMLILETRDKYLAYVTRSRVNRIRRKAPRKLCRSQRGIRWLCVLSSSAAMAPKSSIGEGTCIFGSQSRN